MFNQQYLSIYRESYIDPKLKPHVVPIAPPQTTKDRSFFPRVLVLEPCDPNAWEDKGLKSAEAFRRRRQMVKRRQKLQQQANQQLQLLEKSTTKDADGRFLTTQLKDYRNPWTGRNVIDYATLMHITYNPEMSNIPNHCIKAGVSLYDASDFVWMPRPPGYDYEVLKNTSGYRLQEFYNKPQPTTQQADIFFPAFINVKSTLTKRCPFPVPKSVTWCL